MKNTIKNNAFVIKVSLIVLVIVGLSVIALLLGQKATATSYVGAPRGMIHRAYVTYKDSDTITIQPGYGECCYDYWEITSPVDHDMTSLATGQDWHYIYIDDVNSTYPTPTIKDSTVEPVWSDTKLGWYNGYDRCIGVVWSPDGSATMTSFTTNSSLKCLLASHITLIHHENPTGSLETLEATAYMPVNIISVCCWVWNRDTSHVFVYLSPYSANNRGLVDRSYGGHAEAFGWLDIPKGHSRDLNWWGEDDDDNYFGVYIAGYQIDR